MESILAVSPLSLPGAGVSLLGCSSTSLTLRSFPSWTCTWTHQMQRDEYAQLLHVHSRWRPRGRDIATRRPTQWARVVASLGTPAHGERPGQRCIKETHVAIRARGGGCHGRCSRTTHELGATQHLRMDFQTNTNFPELAAWATKELQQRWTCLRHVVVGLRYIEALILCSIEKKVSIKLPPFTQFQRRYTSNECLAAFPALVLMLTVMRRNFYQTQTVAVTILTATLGLAM
ncbi:hypothetical protein PsorP6_000525 [Peronosclerospora sorghi]|uniref:Uncharacterized protein n=1 Tax=Peronosclerospora sorghi TaxID=230839 RepID=A0ACC0WV41_9STRA|nr:hypothetical protein PsorP6_000525 [Peronosclerospora sorghi]